MHTIIHIGAGQAEQLESFMASGASRILLIEPLPQLAETLRNKTAERKNIEVLELAISADKNNHLLHQYNLAELSSLYPATGLKKIYPGLKLQQKLEVPTLTPSELIARYPLTQGETGELVIEAPGAEVSIIEALIKHHQLKQFSRLVITCPEEASYKSESHAAKLCSMLEQQGYDLKNTNRQDADWPVWQFTRSPLQDLLEASQAELEAIQKAADEARSKVDSLTTEKAQLQQALKESQDKQVKTQAELEAVKKAAAEAHKERDEARKNTDTVKAERDQVRKERDQYKKELEATQQRSKMLDAELANARQQLGTLNKLQDRMEHLFNQQTLQLEQAANALGQHITHTSRETTKGLQAFATLHQQTGINLETLEYQGQKLLPELALNLSQQIKNGSYDVILEMGCSATTSLMAQTLAKQVKLLRSNNQQGQYLEADERDLPKRILVFQHQRSACQQLQEQLTKEAIDHLVDIQFSPLIEHQLGEQKGLYYAMQQRLLQLASYYENRQANILLVIHPGAEGLAINLHLGLLQPLQYLSMHQMDVLLLPGCEQQTPALIENWIKTLNARGLEYQQLENPAIGQPQLHINP